MLLSVQKQFMEVGFQLEDDLSLVPGTPNQRAEVSRPQFLGEFLLALCFQFARSRVLQMQDFAASSHHAK